MHRRALRIKIFGQVQGVWFRGSAREKAKELNIVGFARNEVDGSVFIEAVGTPKALDSFLTWCHEGPDFAQVEKIQVESMENVDFDSFLIY